MSSPRSTRRRRRSEAGFSLLEALIAGALLSATSISLALTVSTGNLAGKSAEQAATVQESLESVRSTLDQTPARELLSLDGTEVDRGDHIVRIQTRQLRARLLAIELSARPPESDAVHARLVTYRCTSQ